MTGKSLQIDILQVESSEKCFVEILVNDCTHNHPSAEGPQRLVWRISMRKAPFSRSKLRRLFRFEKHTSAIILVGWFLGAGMRSFIPRHDRHNVCRRIYIGSRRWKLWREQFSSRRHWRLRSPQRLLVQRLQRLVDEAQKYRIVLIHILEIRRLPRPVEQSQSLHFGVEPFPNKNTELPEKGLKNRPKICRNLPFPVSALGKKPALGMSRRYALFIPNRKLLQ